MTLEIESEILERHLVYRMKGITSSESMVKLADKIREDSDASGIKYALLDCAGMSGSLQIAALHRVGEYFGKTLANVRLAAINSPPSWKANHFSEDVVGSRGGELRHFASRESALRWLLEI
jgi:hypothetical protein